MEQDGKMMWIVWSITAILIVALMISYVKNKNYKDPENIYMFSTTTESDIANYSTTTKLQ